MKIPTVISYYFCYGWGVVRSVLRSVQLVFLLTLPFSAFTILLALIQGLVLGSWYHRTMVTTIQLLVSNIAMVKTYEWFDLPGQSFLRVIRPPYNIQQLHNPINWAGELGLVRPRDWSSDNIVALATFRDLYRIRRRYSDDKAWYHWIYLTANEQPLNETWNTDPWDQAFLELLQYRDKHEPLGRSNFHYITCPKSFLCKSWSISGPALMLFTNEPITWNATQEKSRKPIRDPVHVRVFEFPIQEPVIPGSFPSYFEQMRSITASNSTYWTSRTEYSNFDQVQGQALKVLKKLEHSYPQTYGMLVKVEEKWINLWAVGDTAFIFWSRHIVFIAGAASTFFGTRAWETVQLWWKSTVQNKLGENNSSELVTHSAAEDPVAYELQHFLDSMSDDDKDKFGKTYGGGKILDRIQNGLEKKDWNTIEEVIKEIEGSLGTKTDSRKDLRYARYRG